MSRLLCTLESNYSLKTFVPSIVMQKYCSSKYTLYTPRGFVILLSFMLLLLKNYGIRRHRHSQSLIKAKKNLVLMLETKCYWVIHDYNVVWWKNEHQVYRLDDLFHNCNMSINISMIIHIIWKFMFKFNRNL